MVRNLKSKIEASLVDPLFESIRLNGHGDRSLPNIVLDNRKRRAHERVLQALLSRGTASIPAEMQTRVQSMVENWSNQAFDDAFQPIQEFEIQCARERDLVQARESGDPQKVLDIEEKDYRRRLTERFGKIELRGIQLNHRVILELEQVYVPLHFEELTSGEVDNEHRIVLSRQGPRTTTADILKDNARVFLIGTPGSGKSTLVSLIASRCASGTHGMALPKGALPFVIVVRELKDAAIGEDWLANHLGLSRTLVTAVLSEKRAVLLIDGLDEAPEELRGQLIGSLLQFVAQ